ncbi:hypothetical protein ACFPVY_03945 [Flavobacterium qiangtangense]|uniref:Uncharacterized protein n=1 Tax=Flavobacterium qiangtangense TaxID=1442595 RepID=A0ABW1PJI1_9FLAO
MEKPNYEKFDALKVYKRRKLYLGEIAEQYTREMQSLGFGLGAVAVSVPLESRIEFYLGDAPDDYLNGTSFVHQLEFDTKFYINFYPECDFQIIHTMHTEERNAIISDILS